MTGSASVINRHIRSSARSGCACPSRSAMVVRVRFRSRTNSGRFYPPTKERADSDRRCHREPLIHIGTYSFSPRVASQIKTQATFDGRLLTGDVQKYRGQAVGAELDQVVGRDRNDLFASHRHPAVLSPPHSYSTSVWVHVHWNAHLSPAEQSSTGFGSATPEGQANRGEHAAVARQRADAATDCRP
jgi:hypothetical protein